MYASFLYPLPYKTSTTPHLWLLYHQLSQNQNIELIASEEYFKQTNTLDEDELIELIRMQLIFGFENTSNEQIKFSKKNIVSIKTIKELQAFYPNNIELFKSLTLNRSLLLESSIEPIFQALKAKGAKSVITWHNFPSVKLVAEKYGLKPIHIEGGAFRRPIYNYNTAFFDFEGAVSQNDYKNLFKKFKKELSHKKIDLLEKKELLNLFLTSEIKNHIEQIDNKPQYKLGIALQAENDFPFDELKNSHIINKALKVFDRNEILIRNHPANVDETSFEGLTVDTSANQLEFIQKCESIISFHSNISLEAALFDKTVYTMRKSPYDLISHKDIKSFAVKKNLILELNFIVFCLFAPMDIMYKKEYLDFRMSNPSLIKIFNYHRNYYLKKNEEIRIYNVEDRLKKLLNEATNKNVCFYGAGKLCEKLLKEHQEKLKEINIIGLIDKFNSSKSLNNYKIYKPNDITSLNPDVVFISVLNHGEIKKELMKICYEKDITFEII